jgi:hypothetical protein
MKIELEISDDDMRTMLSCCPQEWIKGDNKELIKKYIESLIENHVHEVENE